MSIFTVIPRFIISGYKEKEISKERMSEDMQKIAQYMNNLNENQLYLYRNVRELKAGFGKIDKMHKQIQKISIEVKKVIKEDKQLSVSDKHIQDLNEISSQIQILNRKHELIENKIKSIEKDIDKNIDNKKDVGFLAETVFTLHNNQRKIISKIIDLTDLHDSVNARIKNAHERTVEMVKDVERVLSKEEVVENIKEHLDHVSAHTNLHASAIVNVRRRLSEVEKMKGFSPKIIDLFTDNEKHIMLIVARARKPLNYKEMSVKSGFKDKTVQKIVSSITKRCNLMQSKSVGDKKQKFFWIDSKYRKDVVTYINRKMGKVKLS